MLKIPKIYGRSHGLDMLRGAFALWVVWIHILPWAASYQSGDAVPAALLFLDTFLIWVFQNAGETHPGVLGFIILSGYCIHRAGFREGASDVETYAVRRFFRIYPVYALAIVAGIVGWSISRSVAPPGMDVGGTTSIEPFCVLARATGVVTVIPSLHRCAFLGNAPLNTVMTEIWLYIAYPLLLLGVGRRFGDKAMWGAIVAIWAVGVAAMTVDPGLRHWWNTASLPGFLIYWWIGAKAIDPNFVAFLQRHKRSLLIAWAVCTVPIFMGWISTPLLVEGRKLLLALLLALLIARLDAARVADNPLAKLGLSGYSLYAFHAPLAYTLLIFGVSWPVVIMAAIAAGAAGYVLVERPGIELGAGFLKRRLLMRTS